MNNYKKIKRSSVDEMAKFLSGLLTDCTKCPARKEHPSKVYCNKASDCSWTIGWWLSQQAKIDKEQ